jgi:hypothetical protein
MKKLIAACLISCCGLCAQAQLSVPISEDQAKSEQTRINNEREELEAQFVLQEADCYQRFAVNDCFREVRARKRISMEALRRQEIVLNDVKRKTKALEQAKQAQENISPAALKQDADSRESVQIQHKERLDRAQEKKINASQREMQSGADTHQLSGAIGASTQGSGKQAQQAFEEKQRSAQLRKAQRDKSLAEKSAKPISPLPAQP